MSVLRSTVIWAPGFVSLLGLYAAFTPKKEIDPNDPLIPLKRNLSALERGLERRAKFGDAVVGILAHSIVYLSSERMVRCVAKAGYAFYLSAVLYLAPVALRKLVKVEEGENSVKDNDVVKRDIYILSGAALLNFVGAALLYVGIGAQHPPSWWIMQQDK